MPSLTHCLLSTASGQSSTGEMVQLDDIDVKLRPRSELRLARPWTKLTRRAQVYLSKPADYPYAPSRLLLLLTGGTGIKSVNNQIQADKYAAEGFLVLMPDLFAGDTVPGTAITDDSTSLLEQVKIKAAELTKSFLIDMWLARITPDKVMPVLNRVIDAARDKYADAVRNGDGIYAVGYCVGGRFVLLLAKETQPTQGGDEESAPRRPGPKIKAGALAHAASVTPEDFCGLKAPVSIVCVEHDPLFPDAVRTAGEDIMSDEQVEHEVQVYPGVPHGTLAFPEGG